MNNIIKQLNEKEIKLACEIANNIYGEFIEPDNLCRVYAPTLKHQIKKDMASLTVELQMIASEILMKIQWEHHKPTDQPDSHHKVHTKIGNIYCKLSQVDYGEKVGLFKLITMHKHEFRNGQDVVFGEFEDLIDKAHIFSIWFDPNITHIINNN